MKDENEFVRVEQGDVMKFGRVRFRVKNLVTEAMHSDSGPLPSMSVQSPKQIDKKSSGLSFGTSLNRVNPH